jgi:hypothetical protein
MKQTYGPLIVGCAVAGALFMFLLYKGGGILREQITIAKLKTTPLSLEFVSQTNPTYLSFISADSERSVTSSSCSSVGGSREGDGSGSGDDDITSSLHSEVEVEVEEEEEEEEKSDRTFSTDSDASSVVISSFSSDSEASRADGEVNLVESFAVHTGEVRRHAHHQWIENNNEEEEEEKDSEV